MICRPQRAAAPPALSRCLECAGSTPRRWPRPRLFGPWAWPGQVQNRNGLNGSNRNGERNWGHITMDNWGYHHFLGNES